MAQLRDFGVLWMVVILLNVQSCLLIWKHNNLISERLNFLNVIPQHVGIDCAVGLYCVGALVFEINYLSYWLAFHKTQL